MITKLTPAQKLKVSAYREKFRAIGLSTEPCNRAEAERAIKDTYAYLKQDEPEFVWCQSPFEGARLAAQTAKGSESVTDAEIQAQASLASYGSFEAYWASFYSFTANELPVEKDNLHDIVTRIVQNCGVYWTFEGLVIMTERPVSMSFDEQQRLHCETGPALKYADGSGVYALHGVRVPKWTIMTPREKLDKKRVLALTNTEQRTAVMRHIGYAYFLKEMGAKLLDEDGEYRLYTLEIEGNTVGPYLYMTCPSSGRIFLEGVGDPTKYEFLDPTIETCKDALRDRMLRASNMLMTKFNAPKNWKMHA